LEEAAFDAGHVGGAPGDDDVFDGGFWRGCGGGDGEVDAFQDALVAVFEDVFPEEFLDVGVHSGEVLDGLSEVLLEGTGHASGEAVEGIFDFWGEVVDVGVHVEGSRAEFFGEGVGLGGEAGGGGEAGVVEGIL
jgi:hypothetical protein